MARDLEAEIDVLRGELKTLAEVVRGLGRAKQPQPRGDAREPSDAAEAQAQAKAREKCPRAYDLREQHPDHQAFVSYFGFLEAGDSPDGQGYYWDLNRSGDALLAIDDDRAAKVLAALASKQRLAILKSILRQPASATDLVERLNLGTTGQVYHHLKALLSADLIMQEERGLFCFRGHRVSGLLMLLSGVAGMLDERYSSGSWEKETDV